TSDDDLSIRTELGLVYTRLLFHSVAGGGVPDSNSLITISHNDPPATRGEFGHILGLFQRLMGARLQTAADVIEADDGFVVFDRHLLESGAGVNNVLPISDAERGEREASAHRLLFRRMNIFFVADISNHRQAGFWQDLRG